MHKKTFDLRSEANYRSAEYMDEVRSGSKKLQAIDRLNYASS
jgi:hypothetical protein